MKDIRRGRHRLLSLIGSAVVVCGMIAVLLIGLRVTTGARLESALDVFDIGLPPHPPEPADPPVQPSEQPEGGAAPPALKARPKPVAAPPVVPLRPPSVVAPPIAAEGSAARAGAVEQPGPGTGAGGIGSGLGSGGSGDGSGGGSSARPRRVRGSITNRDYPPSAYRAGASGRVIVTLDVAADGRVTGCAVMRSSGDAALDSTTCDLARRRFRYAPARDVAGRPVPSQAGYRQDWWLEGQAQPEG